MSEVKFDFAGKTIPDKILFARNVITKMTGNANFVTPNPTLLVLKGGADALETAAENAADGGKTLTATMHSKEAALVALMKTEAAYVQEISKGDALIINSGGWQIKGSKSPVGDMPLVENAKASRNDNAGQVDLQWKAVKGARAYKIEYSPTPTVAGSWLIGGVSTKSKFSMHGLTSGVNIWFRISAIGAAGTGPSSDTAKQMPS